MGLQDRDYWKERYDENMGIRSQPTYRKDVSKLEKLRFFSSRRDPGKPWHWLLQMVLLMWICIGTFAVFRLINYFI